MINRVELKSKAKEFAFKNKWNFWAPLLVMSILLSLVNVIFLKISF